MYNNDDEELDYVSSAGLLAEPEVETKPLDEENLSSLHMVQKNLEKTIASYGTIDRLDFGDKTFTIEQQLAINKAIVVHLKEQKAYIDTALDNITEKYKNG